MPGKKPICASQANNMALKTVLVLALASGAAAADKICMADETNKYTACDGCMTTCAGQMVCGGTGDDGKKPSGDDRK